MGNVIEMGVVGMAVIAYLDDRKKERRRQDEMHGQNRQRLDTIGEFVDEQKRANGQHAESVLLLSRQTAAFEQMAKGFDRRLQMLEDRRSRDRGSGS